MNDIDAWIKKIGDQPVPVLGDTIRDLKRLCAMDDVPVPEITNVVERDPGLTVQILRSSNLRRRNSLSTDVTSVKQALMMMGTAQLSKLPERLPDIEKSVSEATRQRLLKIFSRAYHAGRQASYWAVQRRDMTPDEVFAAAELHFLGEMLFAMVAPEKLHEIDELRKEKHISSEEAQYLVLGFSLNQFTRALARRWQLPRLVVEALHDGNAQYPRAYGIMLAVQVAQCAFIDWYSPRTLEFYQMTAEWLNDDIENVIRQSHRLAVDIARNSELYHTQPAAALLPMLPSVQKLTQEKSAVRPSSNDIADICLIPQPGVLKSAIQEINKLVHGKNALELIARAVHGMHDGIGLNRVVFAEYDPVTLQLKSRIVAGASNDPHFSRFNISLKKPSLFSELMKKTQGILINDVTRQKFWPMIPEEFARFIGTNSFIAVSLHIKSRPLGLFYADRHTSSCQLDNTSYNYFKTLSVNIGKILENYPRIVLEE